MRIKPILYSFLCTPQGDTNYRPERRQTWMNSLETRRVKYGKKCLELMGFSEKSNIILDNIDYSFETSVWNFFIITKIMCQIFFRSDVWKKKVGYPTHTKRYSSFC